MERATVIVVLGAPVLADGTPGPDLAQRLEAALALASNGQLIAVTGGAPRTYGSSGARAEGLAGRDFLVARKKPSDEVLVEDAAKNTFENALLTRVLLKKRREWNEPLLLLVVTNDWHVVRARQCFETVYGRDAHVELQFHAVPSDPEDPVVVQRKEKEAAIMASKSVERKAKLYKDHPGMH
jgi:uncharacterized SAM-binding protein YcdF (DUF218 family)